MSEETQPAGLGDGLSPEATAQTTESTSTGLDFSSPDTYKQFVDTLPEDIKGYKAFAETENLQSLANQLVNAQSALGKKRLEAPSPDWTDENWNEFYGQLRPENDEYLVPEQVVLPEGYEGNAPEFAEETIQELVDFAGQLGLTQRQFDALYNRWGQMAFDSNQMEQADTDEAIKGYRTEILGEWKEDFEQNLKVSKEAFATLAQEIPELNQLVADNPTFANHPGVLKLFHKLASATGDLLPSMANNPSDGFGGNTALNIQAQIRDLDTQNQELILSEPSRLNLADRAKREQLLQKRAELYQKLYS